MLYYLVSPPLPAPPLRGGQDFTMTVSFLSFDRVVTGWFAVSWRTFAMLAGCHQWAGRPGAVGQTVVCSESAGLSPWL